MIRDEIRQVIVDGVQRAQEDHQLPAVAVPDVVVERPSNEAHGDYAGARARYERAIPHPIGIAYDEWNVWYRTRTPEARKAGIEEQYTLADALAVATYLNIFIRHCRAVPMANFAQLVNAIAPIFTSRDGLFLQTIYHPLRLYAEHAGETALDLHVESETYDVGPHETPETLAVSRELGLDIFKASIHPQIGEVGGRAVPGTRDQQDARLRVEDGPGTRRDIEVQVRHLPEGREARVSRLHAPYARYAFLACEGVPAIEFASEASSA